MQEEINSVNEAIQESNTSIIEFGNSIRDIQWDIFDKIQDMISGITDESDFLVKLMSSKDLFDDKGVVTNYGMATMGLHGVNYNTYMSQADEYRKEMEKIESELKSSPYNQDLIERRKELLELQQESILAAEDEKQAIHDLVEDGINKELDALKDLIDEYTDALDSQKDMYDYQKKLAEKQKEINELEKRLVAYNGDDSEEGSANRQKWQNELNELKVDLEETQYDKSIAEQKKLLDELYDEYETVLNMRLDNLDMLIADVIGNVNSEASAIRDTLITEAESVGYQLTDSMNTIWTNMNGTLDNGTNKITSVITVYGDKFTSATTSVQTAINDLKNIIQQAVNASNAKATSNVDSAKKQQTQQTTQTKPTTKPSAPAANTSGGDGVPRVGDVCTLKSGQRYYYDSWGTNPSGDMFAGVKNGVKINGYSGTEYGGQASLHGDYGVSLSSADGQYQLGWVRLDQLEGYKSGSNYITKDQWARVGEDGTELILSDGTVTLSDGTVLRKLNQGDKVLTNPETENMYKWAKINPVDLFSNSIVDTKLPEFTPVNKTSNVQNDIDLNIAIDKVLDYNDIVTQLQKDDKFTKLVQEVTFGQALGHGNLRKFQIKF